MGAVTCPHFGFQAVLQRAVSMCGAELAIAWEGPEHKCDMGAGGAMGVGARLSGGLAQLWRTALAWLNLRYGSSH